MRNAHAFVAIRTMFLPAQLQLDKRIEVWMFFSLRSALDQQHTLYRCTLYRYTQRNPLLVRFPVSIQLPVFLPRLPAPTHIHTPNCIEDDVPPLMWHHVRMDGGGTCPP